MNFHNVPFCERYGSINLIRGDFTTAHQPCIPVYFMTYMMHLHWLWVQALPDAGLFSLKLAYPAVIKDLATDGDGKHWLHLNPLTSPCGRLQMPTPKGSGMVNTPVSSTLPSSTDKSGKGVQFT